MFFPGLQATFEDLEFLKSLLYQKSGRLVGALAGLADEEEGIRRIQIGMSGCEGVEGDVTGARDVLFAKFNWCPNVKRAAVALLEAILCLLGRKCCHVLSALGLRAAECS